MRYGWVSYYLKLSRLKKMNEADRMIWLYDELRSANASPRNPNKVRRLLHCTDFPYHLQSGASEKHSKDLSDFFKQALDAYHEMPSKKEADQMIGNDITFSIKKGKADELWMEYIHGYQKTTTEIEQTLETTQDETIYYSGLINQPSAILNFINKIIPGYYNFSEWYRLKITDKRILMSEYGGLSSWRILNIPVSYINSFNFDGTQCKILLSPDGNLNKMFEVDRDAAPIIKDAFSKACPLAQNASRKL